MDMLKLASDSPETIENLKAPSSLKRWSEDSFHLQLASAALAQFGFKEIIRPEEFLDYYEDLVTANGDDELLEDVLDRLPRLYLQRSKNELNMEIFAMAGEWFERATGLCPQSNQLKILSEDYNSTIEAGAGGSHLDYRDEIKEQWRTVWRIIVAGLMAPEDRANMKILCLPSPQVWPEIRHYLELGFSAKNIYGVEGGDAEARRVFKLNAERYGIQAIIGRLNNVMPKRDEVFDVVLLDFLGPLSASVEEIASSIKLSDRSLVGLNLMGARENLATQGSLKEVASSMGYLAYYISRISKDIMPMTASQPFWGEARERMEQTSQSAVLKEIRDVASIPALLDPFQTTKKVSPLFDEILNELEKEQDQKSKRKIDQDLQALVSVQSLDVLQSFLDKTHNLLPIHSSLIRALVAPAIQSVSGRDRFPLFVQNVGYYSKISGGKIPYLSTFALLERLPDQISKANLIGKTIARIVLKELLRFHLFDVPIQFKSVLTQEDGAALDLSFASGQSYHISFAGFSNEIKEVNRLLQPQGDVLRKFPFAKHVLDRDWLNE